MTRKLQHITFGAIVTLIAVALFASVLYTAKANPSFFLQQNNGTSTLVATTSPTFLPVGGGLATTTYYLDAGAGGSQGADTAALLVQLTGTTSPPSVNINFEYAVQQSIDCIANPNGCDWYADAYTRGATTTVTSTSLNQTSQYRLDFASTTVGGAAGTRTIMTRIVDVKTPTRYLRAVISSVVGGPAGAVWASFIAKRQAN